MTSGAFSLETADWASNGQPILDRYADKFHHFIPGAAVGATAGLFLGAFAPNLIEKPGFDRFLRFMDLDKDAEIATQIIALIIAIPLSFLVSNGYFQLVMIFTIYYAVHYFFKSKQAKSR